MSPETWINILYTYGPNAVLILLVFVIEKKVRSAWREADATNRATQNLFRAVYGVTWLVIFTVAVWSICAWWVLNLSRRPQITGTVLSLPNVEVLGTTCADLYLHKVSKGGGYSDYDLLLINKDQKQWPDGTKVRFIIQAPRPNSRDDDIYEYELPIRSEFYKTGLILKRRQDKLILDYNGKEDELAGGLLPPNALPGGVQASAAPPTSTLEHKVWDLIPTAHAQAQQSAQMAQPVFSKYEYQVGLESPDALVRRKTRYTLSLQDQSVAIPWIDSVLSDSSSSYRLRLGVLAALNHMPNLRAESLMHGTVTAIQNTLNDPDDAMRNEALGLANRYHLIPVTVYEDFDFSGKSQDYGPGTFRADQGRLGSLPNDSASSLRVAKGFTVRMCENEGEGKGSGMCETFGPGDHTLPWGPKSLGDKVSFVEVRRIE